MLRRRTLTASTLAVLGLALWAPAALAAPPNNSYPIPPRSAYHVPINTTYFQEDTSDADTQSGEPLSCKGQPLTKTVWFRVTGQGGNVRITTDADYTTYDTIVAVYEATPDGRPAAMVDCDDDTTTSQQSELTVPLAAGRDYMIQIGGCNACAGGSIGDSGDLSITMLGNDSRATPETLTPGATVTRTNWFATAGGEVQDCRGAAYGNTVWFRFDSPAKGRASFTASGNTVIAVYRGGNATPESCSGDTVPGTVGVRTTLEVGQGEYLLQVGGRISGGSPYQSTLINVAVEFERDLDVDDDGLPAGPQDCDDNDPTRNSRAVDVPFNGKDENCDGKDNFDRDNDHFDARPFGADCDDGNHGINPTAREVPGNRADENCDGRKAPGDLPRLNIDLKANRIPPDRLIFGRLRVSPVRRGYRVAVKCKGRRLGCPRRGLTKRIRRGRSFQSNYTYAKVLRNGAYFEVTVTWPGTNNIGVVKRFSVKAGKLRQRTCDMVPRDETGRAFRRRC